MTTAWMIIIILTTWSPTSDPNTKVGNQQFATGTGGFRTKGECMQAVKEEITHKKYEAFCVETIMNINKVYVQ